MTAASCPRPACDRDRPHSDPRTPVAFVLSSLPPRNARAEFCTRKRLKNARTMVRPLTRPESVPALIDANRKLLIELCFIVGPVEPDLVALDVAQCE